MRPTILLTVKTNSLRESLGLLQSCMPSLPCWWKSPFDTSQKYLLLKGGHTSPLIGPVTGPEVLIWCHRDALIDGLSAQLMVVHLLCPVIGTPAFPLSLFIILNQPPHMLAPLLLVPNPVPIACVYCGEFGHSVWQCHDFNRPCSPSSLQVHPPTPAVDSLLIPNRTPIPSNPSSASGHFQSEVSHNPQTVLPLSTPMNTQKSVPQVNGPAEPIPEKGDDNNCIITDYISPTKKYTTVAVGYSKGLKATMPTPLVKNLLAQGHMGILQPKLLLPKDHFTSPWVVTLNKTPNKVHEIRNASDNLLMYCQTQFVWAFTPRYIKQVIHMWQLKEIRNLGYKLHLIQNCRAMLLYWPH